MTKKIKFVANLYTGNSISDADKEKYQNKLIPYISSKDIDVTTSVVDYDNGMSTDYCDRFKIAKKDSSLLCIEGGSAGRKICYLSKKVSFVNKLCCFEPKSVNGRYLFYSLQSHSFLSSFYENLSGMIGGVSINILNNIKIPVIESSKQTAISNYLDKKVSAIDEFIKKEEIAIGELKEYSISLISDSITKGLKKEPLKNNKCSLDIVKLPCSWTKNKLVRLAYCKSGSTPDRNSNYFWDNPTINWMASGEVNKKFVYDTDEKISEWAFKKNSLRLHPINTVMLALNGQGKTKGMVAITKIKTTCNQSLLGMTCYSRLHYKFLYYYFRAVYKPLRSQVGDKSREGLSGDFIKSLIIPLPDIKEQQQIVDYLDKKCDAIDSLIKLKEQKIEKLKEYKKSLIYECVTGRREIACQMN